MKCEGYRRRGGTFTLGPVVWEQCKGNAIVMLQTVGNDKPLPACNICWQECVDSKIEIISVKPIITPTI
jgi:hypothetical protein